MSISPISRLLGRSEPLQPLVQTVAAAQAPETTLLPLLSLQMLRSPPHRSWLEAAIRARCHTVPLAADLLLCRILGRFKFHVEPQDEGFAPHLLLDGYWEYWVTDQICRMTQPGMVAIDVGANAGYYSVLMADLVGSSGHVHAVEPGRRSLRLLRRNLAVNGFTGQSTVHPLAVGASRGTAVLRSTPAEPKNAYVVPEGLPEQAGVHEEIVQIAPLDELVETAHIIKIDVEGHEELAWAGMQRLLDRSPDVRVLLEFNATRCLDPAALLRDIARRFPLRFLDFDAVVKPAETALLLDSREDTMLLLAHGD